MGPWDISSIYFSLFLLLFMQVSGRMYKLGLETLCSIFSAFWPVEYPCFSITLVEKYKNLFNEG